MLRYEGLEDAARAQCVRITPVDVRRIKISHKDDLVRGGQLCSEGEEGFEETVLSRGVIEV